MVKSVVDELEVVEVDREERELTVAGGLPERVGQRLAQAARVGDAGQRVGVGQAAVRARERARAVLCGHEREDDHQQRATGDDRVRDARGAAA